jgi:hypothetical protein
MRWLRAKRKRSLLTVSDALAVRLGIKINRLKMQGGTPNPDSNYNRR